MRITANATDQYIKRPIVDCACLSYAQDQPHLSDRPVRDRPEGAGMNNRWQVLALLFGVRVAMAFQFQAVAALSPLIMSEFKVGIADIGLLIGLYLSPGILLAIPGGAIGRRFGEKSVVLAGLLLMTAGGLVTATSGSWEMHETARLAAGIGGVLLNVLMTKMVVDWFAGKEIATAMGIFVNSWPVGIALALLVLPGLAQAASLNVAMLAISGFTALAFIALAIGYRPPPHSEQANPVKTPLRGAILGAVICAGLIWGLYNAALGMIFGFAPAMLAERGWSAAAASSVTSIVLWLVALSVPLGGILADRLKRGEAVLLAGLVVFGVVLAYAARTEAVYLSFALLGLVAGIPAGPIMSLPTKVLPPENRAVGMGLFYALFYLLVVLAPIVAGHLADIFGRTSIAFDLGIAMLAVSVLPMIAYGRLVKNLREDSAAHVRMTFRRARAT
jgi:MFS family permease